MASTVGAMLVARSAPECRLYIDLNPCSCGDNLIDCGVWDMQNCVPD